MASLRSQTILSNAALLVAVATAAAVESRRRACIDSRDDHADREKPQE